VKKATSAILRVSITAVLLIFLFSKTDILQLRELVRTAHKGMLAAAFGLFFLLNLLVLGRWQCLVRARGLRVGVFRLFCAYLSGLLFNLVLPSTVGGDAVRTLDIADHTGQHSSVLLGTVVMDRVGGFFGLFTVLLFSLGFGFRRFQDPRILTAAAVLCVGLALLLGIMFSRRFFRLCFGWLPFVRIKEYLRRVHAVTWGYRGKKGVLLTVWLISVAIHVGLAFVFLLTAAALGERMAVLHALMFVPMVTAFSSLPFSIGGLGLRDAATVFVFTKVGLATETAFAISLLTFGFMVLMGLMGGASYIGTLSRRRA